MRGGFQEHQRRAFKPRGQDQRIRGTVPGPGVRDLAHQPQQPARIAARLGFQVPQQQPIPQHGDRQVQPVRQRRQQIRALRLLQPPHEDEEGLVVPQAEAGAERRARGVASLGAGARGGVVDHRDPAGRKAEGGGGASCHGRGDRGPGGALRIQGGKLRRDGGGWRALGRQVQRHQPRQAAPGHGAHHAEPGIGPGQGQQDQIRRFRHQQRVGARPLARDGRGRRHGVVPAKARRQQPGRRLARWHGCGEQGQQRGLRGQGHRDPVLAQPGREFSGMPFGAAEAGGRQRHQQAPDVARWRQRHGVAGAAVEAAQKPGEIDPQRAMRRW